MCTKIANSCHVVNVKIFQAKPARKGLQMLEYDKNLHNISGPQFSFSFKLFYVPSIELSLEANNLAKNIGTSSYKNSQFPLVYPNSA
jgi:hypothetical protein